ncbi:non-specific lipid transfer protein GPI-anchored 20-like [Bidens hawaiensis]|uniref:non-specific lipid transfer protein GPI-anchored 20-like n=1 Tax=Bidens hawaiensis TaxID=980011 RepID=UPI00404B509B
MAFQYFVLTLVVALCFGVAPVYSQITTPCSASMITSFTPCLNFITNSTTNGSSTPTSDCCNSLKSLTSSGTDCLCLIVTGSVPFQIPINRTLAISLPRVCRMPGVPLQCKAAVGSPIPAPGPATLGLAPSPESSSTVPDTTPLAPESDTLPTLTPPSTGVASGVPTTDAGSRPSLTPSSVASVYANSPFVIVASGVTFIWYFLF